jgi:hypothetical protein
MLADTLVISLGGALAVLLVVLVVVVILRRV